MTQKIYLEEKGTTKKRSDNEYLTVSPKITIKNLYILKVVSAVRVQSLHV
jgi:hypothetical protein